MTDRVGLYNIAYLLLEEGKRVESIDEGSVQAKRMNVIYEATRDELLEEFPWNFATTRATRSALSDAPAFGWDYQYTLPSDMIRLLPLRENGSFEGEPIPHEIESLVQDETNPETTRVNVVLTNSQAPLKIHYIARVTNEAQFTPLFKRALACRLALNVAHAMTGKQSYVERIQKMYEDAIMKAMRSNDVQSTIARPITSTGSVFPDFFEARQ